LVGTSYTIKDFTDNEPNVEVWDENWDVLQLYDLYSTQWRMSANGPIALDYTIFFHELDRKGLAEKQYDDFVAKLRIIEPVALRMIHRE